MCVHVMLFACRVLFMTSTPKKKKGVWFGGSLLPLTFPSWTDDELQGGVHRSQRCFQTQSKDICKNNCSRSLIAVPQMFIRNNNSVLINTNS